MQELLASGLPPSVCRRRRWARTRCGSAGPRRSLARDTTLRRSSGWQVDFFSGAQLLVGVQRETARARKRNYGRPDRADVVRPEAHAGEQQHTEGETEDSSFCVTGAALGLVALPAAVETSRARGTVASKRSFERSCLSLHTGEGLTSTLKAALFHN